MSILAISGRKGHGKDVVGKIIEYLTGESTVYPFDLNIDYSHKSNWEVKKFADKLKDIICILIGCTREQLENESFKSKELGEEWWYWYMERDGGYSPIILDYLTTTKKELKSYEGLKLIKPTPRFLLQFIGTNLFRNQLHPEIWVNSLMSEYKSLYGYQTTDSKINIGGISIPIPVLDIDKRVFPNWIITDMRFPNELEAVKKRGGITIRVNRPCDICGGSGYHKMIPHKINPSEHSSESALANEGFDYEIINDGTISDLIDKIRIILIENNLINVN